MVTVIIPALNEQETIGKVVTACLNEHLVKEVIVVDDQSADNTKQIAEEAGAIVITSKKRGKGISMKEGIEAASNQLIVFLDGDIHPYPAGTIANLVQPLIKGQCDFVKGTFARKAGRVTELVAKPLLKIFYPELAAFQQPLSGMIAGRKNYLNKIEFFDGYGVDIGILIDMFLMQARIKEVNIGYIENKSKPWKMLGKMSGEVASAIIKKATFHQNHLVNLEELGLVNEISTQMDQIIKEQMNSIKKIVVFDMDKALLQGDFIDACADKFLFDEELARLRSVEKDPAVLTKRIAKLLRGLSVGELLKVASSIPMVHDALEVVANLKRKGNIVGIISNSYQFVVDYVKNKLDLDFAIGNQLNFFEGKATGEVTIPSYFYYHLQSKCRHTLCKSNVLIHLSHKYNIPIANSIAISGNGADVCLLKQAGMGIAFCSNDSRLKTAADKIIDKLSFAELTDAERLMPLHKRQEAVTV